MSRSAALGLPSTLSDDEGRLMLRAMAGAAYAGRKFPRLPAAGEIWVLCGERVGGDSHTSAIVLHAALVRIEDLPDDTDLSHGRIGADAARCGLPVLVVYRHGDRQLSAVIDVQPVQPGRRAPCS